MALELKLRKYKRDDIDKRVREAAEILGPTELSQRKPVDLSDDRRQCVTMGRVTVRGTEVFLMDEPLSNLDAKLRMSIRAGIAKIHHRIGSATIYTTCDQAETMTLANRIVITSPTKNPDGSGTTDRIEQIGTPQGLCNRPTNKFVVGFIGSSAMNSFEVTAEGSTLINDASLKIILLRDQKKLLETKGYNGKKVIFSTRSEGISDNPLVCDTYPGTTVKAEVTVSELPGTETVLYVKSGDVELVSRTDARGTYEPGERVELALNVTKSHFFDPKTEIVIH